MLLFVVLGSFSCKKDAVSTAYSRLKFYLTDAPARYDAVYIDVKEVMINSGSDTSSGWVSVGLLNPGIYNLLDFTNGLDTLLADAEVPSGKLSQIRLVLGSNNSVVIDSVSYDLKTPSAQSSGLKLSVHQTLEAGVAYSFHLDFDAGRSIVSTGSGKYVLKPVIRVFTEAVSGAIKGVVRPAIAMPYVYVVAGTDTLATLANELGEFRISGVPEGIYPVHFEPSNGLSSKTVSGVAAIKGQVTLMDTVQLN